MIGTTLRAFEVIIVLIFVIARAEKVSGEAGYPPRQSHDIIAKLWFDKKQRLRMCCGYKMLECVFNDKRPLAEKPPKRAYLTRQSN
jgi:hypothetical protein